MWILQCDGDVLKNKSLWLRPGRKFLFGRTSGDQGAFVIEDKSISRKHLTIEVARVHPGDGAQVHTRSKITIEDQGSKGGTRVNGKQLGRQAEVLQGDEHEIYLGRFPQPFRIKWHPVVFSFSLEAKNKEADEPKSKELLADIRSRLEPLDIKIVLPYIYGKTTHVVSTKRNTSKGLQALINGSYIVKDSFIEALFSAAETPGSGDLENASPLEVDFEAAWPNALEHLPPPGQESRLWPATHYAPDPRRAAIFEGYSFVFCERKQFESLQSPITNGGGKALMYELEYEKTTVNDLVRYLKQVAGNKGIGRTRNEDQAGGVVLVRFRGVDAIEDWCIQLGNQVAQALDQRLVEQNEFLEAILLNDASILKRPLPEDDEQVPVQGARIAGSARDPTSGTVDSVRQDTAASSGQAAVDVSQAATKRARSRRTVRIQFKGFDDGFDPTTVSKAPKMFDSASQLKVVEEPAMQPAEADDTHQRSSRKRPTPMPEEEPEDEVMDRLLPAAAAMKKRRIEEEKAGINRQVALPESPPASGPGSDEPRLRKIKKEVDVLAVTRERREAEDEAARRDEESLQALTDKLEISKLRNLAVIEEMPVKPRTHGLDDAGNVDRSRWDDQWNGRKNFKKFRRRGTGEQGQGGGRVPTVIVGLEEAGKRPSGIENEHRLRGADKGRQRREKDRGGNTSFTFNRPTDKANPQHSQTTPFATARSQQSDVDEPIKVMDEDDQDLPDALAPTRSTATTRSRTTRLADKTNTTRHVLASTTSSTMAHPESRSSPPSQAPPPPPPAAAPASSSSKARGKRPASNTYTRAPPPKKQRTLLVRQSDSSGDSDDEEQTRFRFDRTRA